MAATNPTLKIQLTSNNPDVQGFVVKEEEFTFDKVAGGSTLLITGDGFVPIGGHNVDLIERVIIFCADLTVSGTLRINHDPGGGAVDKDIPFVGYFIMKVSADFAAEIALGSGLSLSTDSITSVKYTVKIFGD